MIHLFVEFCHHHRLDGGQQFSCCGRWHAECIGQRQRCRHVPADNRARQHTELATEATDQVPDLPAVMRERLVQPRRAVFAGRLARVAVALAPAEGPFGEDAETFFSCSSSKPFET